MFHLLQGLKIPLFFDRRPLSHISGPLPLISGLSSPPDRPLRGGPLLTLLGLFSALGLNPQIVYTIEGQRIHTAVLTYRQCSLMSAGTVANKLINLLVASRFLLLYTYFHFLA
jgi:hypothetical protein